MIGDLGNEVLSGVIHLFLIQQERTQDEIIKIGIHETAKGILGCTDDRFTPYIERCVNDDGASCLSVEFLDEIVVERMVFALDRL